MPRFPVVFGSASTPSFVEEGVDLVRGLLQHGPGDPRCRVEVDSQLVGVIGVGGQIGPDVETQARQVDGPQHMGQVGGDQRLPTSCRWGC